MSDMGFKIEVEFTLYQAKLAIPDITRRKKQLHPLGVEHTRKVASVTNRSLAAGNELHHRVGGWLSSGCVRDRSISRSDRHIQHEVLGESHEVFLSISGSDRHIQREVLGESHEVFPSISGSDRHIQREVLGESHEVFPSISGSDRHIQREVLGESHEVFPS